ncbi:ATP-binding protein [Streptomyces sp. AS02]|uniref:ATP-binding protein n=1 Tax=Streptomyces sp. AS02 TaxID=2938946 RepID=UPI002022195E|nr:ATP-binding protein [Streptomyces sp. AS02]MCL8015149.1 ATP-binding protein [Streptomyces sp. AS02]
MTNPQSSANPFHEGAAGEYFVGREQQLDKFERSLDALRQSEPSHIFVAGVNGRGKTSYLAKLVEMSRRHSDVLAVSVSLDAGVAALQQITSMFERVVREVDAALRESVQVDRLMPEWQKSDGSPFRLPSADRLQNEHIRHDLSYLSDVAAEQGFRHVVICVDEGERIEPFALSALKSALLQFNRFLVVLSIRLIEDQGDPVGAARRKLEEIAAAADGDLGAARLFVTGVGLQPFDLAQARKCVIRRLQNRTIGFDEGVIDLISRVAEGRPDRIIEYAHDVYDGAAEEKAQKATLAHFRTVFTQRHRLEVSEASSLRMQLTETERRMMYELACQNSPMSPSGLAEKMYPNTPQSTLEPLIESIKSALDKMCASPFCAMSNFKYATPDPVHRYALEISMESE